MELDRVSLGTVDEGATFVEFTSIGRFVNGSEYLRQDGPTIQAVREALAEACEEVEAAVKKEHGWPDVHPAVRHRFDRDMSVVAGWREALTKLDGKE
jgi:hypothetical protein